MDKWIKIMKNLLGKIGLLLLCIITICLALAVFILGLSGIGYLANSIFYWSSEGFWDYSKIGMVTLLGLLLLIIVCWSIVLFMLGFATRYREKKPKRNPQECPYDLKSCDQLNTSGMSKIDCEDCPRYDRGIRPSKFSKHNNEI